MRSIAESPETSGRLADRLAGWLGRTTSSGRLIPEIDGLRFVAIALVILTHVASVVSDQRPAGTVSGWADRVVAGSFSVGWIGVKFFFVISGFILGLPFAEHFLGGGPRTSYARYLRRRVTRLEPPYVINMTLLFGAALVAGGLGRLERLPSYLASVAYLHNVVFDRWSDINFVAYTLEIEVQFYLLAPLLARVFLVRPTGRRRGTLAALIVALGALGVWGRSLEFRYNTLIVFHLQFFLAGFLLADVYLTCWDEDPRPRRLWNALVPATFALTLLTGPHVLAPLITAPLIFLTYVGVFLSPLWRGVFRWRWVVVAGGMCYTTYLYHYWIWRPLGGQLARRFTSLPVWATLLVHAALAFPLIYLASALLFVLFEKPFMYRDWPARVRSLLRPPAAPAVVAVADAQGE